jgi:hypothetical protein
MYMKKKDIYSYCADLLASLHEMHGGGRTPSRSAAVLQQDLHQRGWKRTFIRQQLGNLNDTHLEGITNSDAIDGFSRAWISYLNPTLPTYNSLLKIGVRKANAADASYAVEPLENTCYTPEQLLSIAIDYLNGKFAPVGKPSVPYYIKPATVDLWFPHKTISILNTSLQCQLESDQPLIVSIRTGLPINQDTHQYFYHLTAWRYTKSIMRSISHSVGTECLDFGITPGFYTGDSLLNALEWGMKRVRTYKNELAIIVFCVPKHLPNSIKFLNLHGRQWIAITQQSRMCEETDDEIPDIEEYDIIMGNMVANPRQVKWEGQSPRTHTPPKSQFVSKTARGDVFLQDCLAGCIYFPV